MDTVAFVVAKGKTILDSWGLEVGETIVTRDAPPADPQITFTLTAADADAYRAGSLDLSVGFMRGQVKMAGDFGALLRVLPRLAALQRP